MEGYSKTDKNGLNKMTNDNIYDIDPIMENFTLLDDSIGKVSSVNMQGYNEDTEVGSEKSLSNFIKYLWKSLTGLKKSVDEYKSAMDECVKALGDLVKKHEKTNKILEFAMGLRDDYEE